MVSVLDKLLHLCRRQGLCLGDATGLLALALVDRHDVEDVGRLHRLILFHIGDEPVFVLDLESVVEAPLVPYACDNLATGDASSGAAGQVAGIDLYMIG